MMLTKNRMDRVNEAAAGDRCSGFAVLLIIAGLLIGIAFDQTLGWLGWPAAALALVSFIRFQDYRARWKAENGRKDDSGMGGGHPGATSAPERSENRHSGDSTTAGGVNLRQPSAGGWA